VRNCPRSKRNFISCRLKMLHMPALNLAVHQSRIEEAINLTLLLANLCSFRNLG
jgi:hypothetical protein